jgi:hypothetical protein
MFFKIFGIFRLGSLSDAMPAETIYSSGSSRSELLTDGAVSLADGHGSGVLHQTAEAETERESRLAEVR